MKKLNNIPEIIPNELPIKDRMIKKITIKEAKEKGLKKSGTGAGANLGIVMMMMHKYCEYLEFIEYFTVDLVISEGNSQSERISFWYDPKKVNKEAVKKRAEEIKEMCRSWEEWAKTQGIPNMGDIK